jgi:predicted ATP-binding protein involved in virulence
MVEDEMERFEIENITLSNYRKFENKTFALNPRMNVFVGKNASGKTTALEAVCVMMGAYLAAYKEYVPSQYVFNISDSDILLKENKIKKGVVTPSETKQFPCSVACDLVWDTKTVSYQRIVEKEGGRTKFAGKNPMQKKVLEWEASIKKADISDQNQIYPLVLYLSSARLWNENRSGKAMDKIPARTDAYQRCLDKKRGNQSAFDYIKLLRDIAQEENGGEQYPAYNIIMDAVKYSLKDELQKGQEIQFSSRYGEIALKNEDSTVIRFATLSDGYRNVIKIVTDIATKMCILNPYLEEDVLKLTPGVVIIDELDLSLHPTWQKRIVRILKELFPKVQFICATHSPFIIQSLEEGELIVLDESVEAEDYSGQSIEDIAEEIMGVNIPQYSEKKEEMYRSAHEYFTALNRKDITKEDLRKLKEKADVLAAEYSDNPAYGAYIKLKYMEKQTEVEG